MIDKLRRKSDPTRVVVTTLPASEPDYGKSISFRFDRALSEKFSPLADWMTGQVIEFEKYGFPPLRTLNQVSSAVDCILANFLDADQISPECFVAISLSEQTFTKSRYLKLGFGHTNFKKVLDFLERHGPPYVTFKKGFHDARGGKAIGRVSRYRPSAEFARLLRGYAVTIDKYWARSSFSMDDLLKEASASTTQNSANEKPSLIHASTVYCPSSDIIRLKDSNRKLIEYDDTNETSEMRSRLQQWNDFVSQHHHIDLLLTDDEMENIFDNAEDDGAEEEIFFEDEQQPRYVEMTRVRLHRVFNNGSFEQGGRFYGGWWQAIPSRYRRYITINEYATREFDYSNLHAAMLYARVGHSKRMPIRYPTFRLNIAS